MLKAIKQFFRDEEGATAIEYGLIIGLIAVAIVVILGTIGGQLSGVFNTISDKMTAAGITGG